MKKSIFYLIFILMLTTTKAQTLKGDWLLGVSIGSINHTSSNSKTTYSNTPTVCNSKGNSTSFSIGPTAGYFIRNNHAIGAFLSISRYVSNNNSSNTSSSTTSDSKSTQPSFYIGPF